MAFARVPTSRMRRVPNRRAHAFDDRHRSMDLLHNVIRALRFHASARHRRVMAPRSAAGLPRGGRRHPRRLRTRYSRAAE